MVKIKFNQLLIYCSSDFLPVGLPDGFFEMSPEDQGRWLLSQEAYDLTGDDPEQAWARIEASAYKLADFLESQGVTIIR